MVRGTSFSQAHPDAPLPGDDSAARSVASSTTVSAVRSAVGLIMSCRSVMSTAASAPIVRAILRLAMKCPLRTTFGESEPFPAELLLSVASVLAFCPWARPSMTSTVQMLS